MCSGKLSHVPSQPAVAPSPHGVLSRDQSPQPAFWSSHGTSGNIIAHPSAPIDPVSRLSWNPKVTGGEPMQTSTGRPAARSEERNGDTIPTPRFAQKPSIRDSLFPAEGEYPPNPLVDQRLQISELQFDKFPTPSTFSCWKIRFKIQVGSCSDFPSEAMLLIKDVEMVDSVDELKSSRSIEGEDFPNFEMLDARIASALNKIIQNSYFKKKVSVEQQIRSERGPDPSRETDRLHDLRTIPGHWNP